MFAFWVTFGDLSVILEARSSLLTFIVKFLSFWIDRPGQTV